MVGDYIVYAQRQSSYLWLDIGRVIETGSRKDYRGETEFAKVQGCRDHYLDKPTLKKVGIVTAFERVIVISKEFVPEKYIELLKNSA